MAIGNFRTLVPPKLLSLAPIFHLTPPGISVLRTLESNSHPSFKGVSFHTLATSILSEDFSSDSSSDSTTKWLRALILSIIPNSCFAERNADCLYSGWLNTKLTCTHSQRYLLVHFFSPVNRSKYTIIRLYTCPLPVFWSFGCSGQFTKTFTLLWSWDNPSWSSWIHMCGSTATSQAVEKVPNRATDSSWTLVPLGL